MEKTILHIKTEREIKKLEELLGIVERDIKNKKNLSPAFSTIKEMENYLDSLIRI